MASAKKNINVDEVFDTFGAQIYTCQKSKNEENVIDGDKNLAKKFFSNFGKKMKTYNLNVMFVKSLNN